MTKRTAEMAFPSDAATLSSACDDDHRPHEGDPADLAAESRTAVDDTDKKIEVSGHECDWFITPSDDEAMDMTSSTSPGGPMQESPLTPPSPLHPEILDPSYGHDPESVALDALTADTVTVTVPVAIDDADQFEYPNGPVGGDLAPVSYFNELTGQYDVEYVPASESSTTSTGVVGMTYQEWEAALTAEIQGLADSSIAETSAVAHPVETIGEPQPPSPEMQ